MELQIRQVSQPATNSRAKDSSVAVIGDTKTKVSYGTLTIMPALQTNRICKAANPMYTMARTLLC